MSIESYLLRRFYRGVTGKTFTDTEKKKLKNDEINADLDWVCHRQPSNEYDSINVLQDKDHYEFLGKLESFAQLDDEVFDQVNKEYLNRLNVIWSSNISVPRKIKATNTFALPVI